MLSAILVLFFLLVVFILGILLNIDDDTSFIGWLLIVVSFCLALFISAALLVQVERNHKPCPQQHELIEGPVYRKL